MGFFGNVWYKITHLRLFSLLFSSIKLLLYINLGFYLFFYDLVIVLM